MPGGQETVLVEEEVPPVPGGPGALCQPQHYQHWGWALDPDLEWACRALCRLQVSNEEPALGWREQWGDLLRAGRTWGWPGGCVWQAGLGRWTQGGEWGTG